MPISLWKSKTQLKIWRKHDGYALIHRWMVEFTAIEPISWLVRAQWPPLKDLRSSQTSLPLWHWIRRGLRRKSIQQRILIGCCCCMYCVTRENCIYCVSAQSQSHASTITPYRKPSSGASHLSFYAVCNDNHHTSQSIDQATKNRR